MAKRDPEAIKKDIDRAREQLASTVDVLAERANPQRVADRAKAKAISIAKNPVVVVTVAGLGTLAAVLVVRRMRTRYLEFRYR